MANYKIRCRLNYHILKIDEIDLFSVIIRNGIYNNPLIFLTPPILQAAFQLLIDDFITKRAAYKAGGSAQKGPYNEAKIALMAALDSLSAYVDTVALGNANTITLAGFVPTKGSSTPINPPTQPQGATLSRGLPGELYADCTPSAGVDGWGGLLVANNPIPDGMGINELGQIVVLSDLPSMPISAPGPTPLSIQFIQDLNKARRKKFTGLSIGTTYYFYMWAMNAGGVSPLSVVVSKKVVEG